MGVLSCVGAVPGGKPFETFGKDSIMLRRRKHGTTGRLALPHQHRRKVRLLRPSVQLPAGIHGCAGYKDFRGAGKHRSRLWRGFWPDYRANGTPRGEQGSRLTYLFVYHTNNHREGKMAPESVPSAPEAPSGDPKHAA